MLDLEIQDLRNGKIGLRIVQHRIFCRPLKRAFGFMGDVDPGFHPGLFPAALSGLGNGAQKRVAVPVAAVDEDGELF